MTSEIQFFSPYSDTKFHQRECELHVRLLIPYLGIRRIKMCLNYLVARNQKTFENRDDTERTRESASGVSYCLVWDKQYYLDVMSI